MARLGNTRKEIRALFAKTGNQCAFPGCNHCLIDDDNDFVAQVAHIEAAEKGGPRYNPKMTNEERKSIDNLFVLCYRHHKKTDNTDLYTVAKLKKMKECHENQFCEQPYGIPENALEQIYIEQAEFEHEVTMLNKFWQESCHFAMPFNISEDASVHLCEIFDCISKIENQLDVIRGIFDSLPENIESFFHGLGYDLSKYRAVRYYDNPFCNIEWEMMNIGMTNVILNIRANILAMEYHLEYEKLKNRPFDSSVRAKIEEIKQRITELASSTIVAD